MIGQASRNLKLISIKHIVLTRLSDWKQPKYLLKEGWEMSTGSALPGDEWVTGGLLKLLVLSTGPHMVVMMIVLIIIIIIIIIITTWCGHLAISKQVKSVCISHKRRRGDNFPCLNRDIWKDPPRCWYNAFISGPSADNDVKNRPWNKPTLTYSMFSNLYYEQVFTQSIQNAFRGRVQNLYIWSLLNEARFL